MSRPMSDVRALAILEEAITSMRASGHHVSLSEDMKAAWDYFQIRLRSGISQSVSATTATLIDMLTSRDAVGLKKYGKTLDRTDLSLADWLQHMTEEMLDSAGYAQAALRVLNHFHTELSRALATAKWIDDGSESPNASSARVLISILTGLLETIKQPAPKADSEKITEADLEHMAPLPATSAEADKSGWRIDPEPFQYETGGNWTCGIDIGDHSAAIECHADTREEALLRAQAVMRAAVVPQLAPFASGKINGYLPRQRAVEIKLDSDVPAWMTAVTEVRVDIYPASAAPQASPEPITLTEKLRNCEAALSAAERVIADLLAGKLPEGYVLAPHQATDVIKDAMQPLMPSGSRDITDAANSAAASAKIAASQQAERVRACRAVLAEFFEYGHLFADRVGLCATKAPEDLRNLAAARIAEHQQREAARIEAERERIRREEAERVERERASAERAVAADPPAEPTPEPQPAAIPEVPPKADTGARIKLGDINARISPLSITAEGLASLGFQPVGTERSAKLYAEADFPEIIAAMIRVLRDAEVLKVEA